MKLNLLLCGFVIANILSTQALNNGLGKTPQMGWNSWNFFQCNVNETVVMEAADNIVSSGLAALGYTYVNVDDCWASYRDEQGVIQPDNKTFPSGMAALAEYVHSKGLKFGIYSDSGAKTCAGRPGSLGYEQIDAKTYAEWGVDYLKFDNCNAPAGQFPQERYAVMRDALLATNSPIFFSMCEWGVLQPWNWAAEVGNSWRTDMDIGDDWESYIRVLDNNIGISPYAGPGGWNDPDMMEVGNGGMSTLEYQSHFALWCLLKAPLIIGCDLKTMTNETLDILGAVELIEVNQDSLGAQGDLIYQRGYVQIWAGPLSDGSRAFVLFNRGTIYSLYSTNITLEFSALGFPDGTKGTVRDLFARQDVGVFTDSFTSLLPGHGAFAGRFIPESEEIRATYKNWRPIEL